jgi:hypothetical protein
MRRKKFVSDADLPTEPPLYIREGGFVAGLLEGIEPGEDEGEILATVKGDCPPRIRVSIPLELEGNLRGMMKRDIIVSLMDGKWIAAVQNRCLRPVGWRA